jgi:hypothetical protein
MEKLYFRYKVHPGDFLRNSDVVELPNPNDNLEDFLIWFLRNYQSDNRITYIDDLYKLLHNEFSNESDKADFIKQIGTKSVAEIQEEISLVESELKSEAYENFYHLILSNKIEIIADAKK